MLVKFIINDVTDTTIAKNKAKNCNTGINAKQ